LVPLPYSSITNDVKRNELTPSFSLTVMAIWPMVDILVVISTSSHSAERPADERQSGAGNDSYCTTRICAIKPLVRPPEVEQAHA